MRLTLPKYEDDRVEETSQWRVVHDVDRQKTFDNESDALWYAWEVYQDRAIWPDQITRETNFTYKYMWS